MSGFSRDLAARLQQVVTAARMWGSPAEFEAALVHLSHLAFIARDTSWSFAQTSARWRTHYQRSADDDAEHRVMRTRFWQMEEETARAQVVQGYVVLWAAAPRLAHRESLLTPVIEGLLDAPHTAGTPDVLNAALFSLMGFASSDLMKFAQLLAMERQRIGGHDLRPFHIVGALGPNDAAITYGYRFTDWPQLLSAAKAFVAELPMQNS